MPKGKGYGKMGGKGKMKKNGMKKNGMKKKGMGKKKK